MPRTSPDLPDLARVEITNELIRHAFTCDNEHLHTIPVAIRRNSMLRTFLIHIVLRRGELARCRLINPDDWEAYVRENSHAPDFSTNDQSPIYRSFSCTSPTGARTMHFAYNLDHLFVELGV